MLTILLMVDRDSAFIIERNDCAENIRADKDHSGLNKYESRDDETYISLKGSINTIVASAPSLTHQCVVPVNLFLRLIV